MKKIISTILVCTLLLGCVFVLSACGNISESYAKKVNLAAENDEHYTYTQVLEDLGEDAIDITILKSGVIVAVKGCASVEDISAKIDAGEEVKGIVVTVLAGKAISASYKVITEEDLKK